jgi:photosystem II stability/assembly factor-like uncharacterized protein
VAVGADAQGSGFVTRTDNDGKNWTETQPAEVGNLSAIDCTTTTHCEAVGSDPTGEYGIVIGTTNGGTTWNVQASYFFGAGVGGASYFSGIACPSSTECIAAGGSDGAEADSSGIIETTDGGAKWTQAYSSLNALSAVSCSSTTVCEAAGDFGSAVRTTNGGKSWNNQKLPTELALVGGIACTSATDCEIVSSGFATGYSDGVAVATSDGGTVWSQQPLPKGTGALAGVACLSTSNCEAVGASRAALGTTDGGAAGLPR